MYAVTNFLTLVGRASFTDYSKATRVRKFVTAHTRLKLIFSVHSYLLIWYFWVSQTCPNYLKIQPQKVHFMENVFEEMSNQIAAFWTDCRQEMNICLHKYNRERGESKLKFEVSVQTCNHSNKTVLTLALILFITIIFMC